MTREEGVEEKRRGLTTNSSSLDRLLNGGLSFGVVSLVYGEAETGKTTLAIQCAVNSARRGYKTIFIDSEGTFSPRRLSQIAYNDSDEVSPLIILLSPTTFREQSFAIDHLDEYITKNVGLVIVDTITSLYRVEVGGAKKTFELNRELNRQVACLSQFAKKYNVIALLISQVRSVFAEKDVEIEPVASRVLTTWSDVVLVLEHTGNRVKKALLKKPQRPGRPTSCFYSIERTGIQDHSY